MNVQDANFTAGLIMGNTILRKQSHIIIQAVLFAITFLKANFFSQHKILMTKCKLGDFNKINEGTEGALLLSIQEEIMGVMHT